MSYFQENWEGWNEEHQTINYTFNTVLPSLLLHLLLQLKV